MRDGLRSHYLGNPYTRGELLLQHGQPPTLFRGVLGVAGYRWPRRVGVHAIGVEVYLVRWYLHAGLRRVSDPAVRKRTGPAWDAWRERAARRG